MKSTKIQWCDSTVNPTSGCDGCELWNPATETFDCYAGNLHEGRWAKSLALTHPEKYSSDFKEVRLIPGRVKNACKWKDLRGVERPGKPWIPKDMPRLIFISDMADALSRDVPFEFLLEEIVIPIASSPHVGMWLTKQAKRLHQFSDWLTDQSIEWPANLWIGTSVTSNKTLWRLEHLVSVPAARRFVSYEPAWEFIDWRNVNAFRFMDMLIMGGASKQRKTDFVKPADLSWWTHTIAACRQRDVKPFVKQLGSKPVQSGLGINLRDSHGGNWTEWPEDLRIREFPEP